MTILDCRLPRPSRPAPPSFACFDFEKDDRVYVTKTSYLNHKNSFPALPSVLFLYTITFSNEPDNHYFRHNSVPKKKGENCDFLTSFSAIVFHDLHGDSKSLIRGRIACAQLHHISYVTRAYES